MINILVVAHSYPLAKSLVEFVKEMKQNTFKLSFVAGMNNKKSYGTDANEIRQEMKELLKSNDELLVFYDLGSSLINIKFAIDMLDEKTKPHVHIIKEPLVEGLFVAVTSNYEKVELKKLLSEIKKSAEMKYKIE